MCQFFSSKRRLKNFDGFQVGPKGSEDKKVIRTNSGSFAQRRMVFVQQKGPKLDFKSSADEKLLSYLVDSFHDFFGEEP